MRSKSWLRRAAAGALCLILCAAGLGQTAGAVSAPKSGVDPNKACNLTLYYRHPDVNVKLYKVASMDANAGFTAVRPFTNANMDLTRERDADDWRQLAISLKSELPRIGASPTRQGKTLSHNDQGFISFEKLTPGLYLVVTEKYERVEKDDKTQLITKMVYEVDPYLVSLPTWEGSLQSGKWVYDIKGYAGDKVLPKEETKESLMAVKVWRDSHGNAVSPPVGTTITLALVRDGERVPGSEKVLGEGNKWSCVWDADDFGLWNYYEWTVVELDCPKGWTWSVSRSSKNDQSFVVTNVRPYTPPETSESAPPVASSSVPPSSQVTQPPSPRPSDFDVEDPTPPLGDKTPPPSSSAPPRVTTPPKGTEPPEEIELDDPDVPLGDLPQTGMLWWPVPILAIAGLMLLIVGIIRRRAGGYDDE